MGVLQWNGTDNYLEIPTLATALANVADGAWTAVAVCKRASATANYDAIGYMVTSGNVTQLGMTINNFDNFSCDVSPNFPGGSTGVFPANGTSTYALCAGKGAGAVIPSHRYKIGVGGTMTSDTMAGTLADQAAAAKIQIGTWQGGGDIFNGWIGVYALFEGDMTQANKDANFTNWRTSDIWNNPHGQPKFCMQFNVATGSLVDLAGNGTGLTVVGAAMSVDAAQTLDGWLFDGTGTPVTGTVAKTDWTRFPKPQLRTVA